MSLEVAESNRLAEDHLSLVSAMAREIGKSIGHRARRDELISAGYEGLIEASRRYDPGKEMLFSRYARRRIQGSMYDHVRKSSGSRSQMEMVGPVVFSSRDAQQVEKLYMDPTEAVLGFTTERAIDILRVRRLVAELPNRIRELLELHYFEDLTIICAGRHMGLNKMQCNRLIVKGIRLLRQKLAVTTVSKKCLIYKNQKPRKKACGKEN